MTITSDIISKWREQGTFCRFIDGNTHNCRIENLMWVSQKDAMEHFEDWRTDWDANLSKRERRVVCLQSWRDGLVFTEKPQTEIK